MKVLVFGGNGFIGQAIQQLLRVESETTSAERAPKGIHEVQVDLMEPKTIVDALRHISPDAIVNAAGVVANTDQAAMNLTFTTNILNALVETGHTHVKVIISGSAAEYGEVQSDEIPVKETTSLKATSFYGKSKIDEEKFAIAFAKEHGINLVVARIFNPLGSGMHDKFLVPQLIRQIDEFKNGDRAQLEISRLDSCRDYLDVRDIASAIKILVENPTSHNVYNIGSGESTSNGELLDIILKQSGIEKLPRIIEQHTTPEALVAIQADITRIKSEFGWSPQYSLEETIKDIIDAK